jgi:hypothetical protein
MNTKPNYNITNILICWKICINKLQSLCMKIACISSSCDSNQQSTRESLIQVTSIIPQSKSELLPLYHGAEGDGVDGFEGATRSGSSIISLLSS